MQIEKVVKLDSGFKVNDQFWVPDDSDKPIEEQDSYYKAILVWAENGGVIIAEFTTAQKLSQAQAKKIAEIESKYNLAISSATLGGNIKGVPYYFDREKIKTKMAMIPIFTNQSLIPLETTDGQIIKLSKADFISICSHINDSEDSELTQANARKSAVNALESLEEVQNYDITQTY